MENQNIVKVEVVFFDRKYPGEIAINLDEWELFMIEYIDRYEMHIRGGKRDDETGWIEKNLSCLFVGDMEDTARFIAHAEAYRKENTQGGSVNLDIRDFGIDKLKDLEELFKLVRKYSKKLKR